jgi:hypothetical protein
MSEPVIFPVERLELSVVPKPWAFADERRAEVDAYFAVVQREKPEIWNGRVLLMHQHALTNGVFRGDYLETDYASFCAWRHWGHPPAGVHDCFGAAAVIAADGAVLLGVMGAHTFNAGRIYFPCGTPDRDDIVGGTVDLDFSVRRELTEETGLDAAGFDADAGWVAVADGAEIVMVRRLRSSLNADALRARILGHLASERQPELSDICIVRGTADFTAAMPRFVTAFLAWQFALR